MKVTSFLLLALVNNASYSYSEILFSSVWQFKQYLILSESKVCVCVWGGTSVFLETVLKDLCSALPREMMVYFQIQSNLIVVTPNDIQRTNTLELNE